VLSRRSFPKLGRRRGGDAMRQTLWVDLLTQRRAVRWWQRQQAEKAAAAWPSAGGRRRGSRPQLGRKGEVGHLSHLDWKERWARLDQKWVERSWAGEGGKMDNASREFGPKLIWAA
jgi:hypothetical protein